MTGRRLAHYEIVEKLGQGGMGEVYRAHDPKLGRDVALKILPEEAARDPERRARFIREARSVAALKHPNIVTVHSVEEADGIPFITMELVEGHSLSSMIPPDGLRLDHFFNYAVPLADAVAWAHDRGITHRDLKPANVMIDHDHRVKVLDFGLAKVFAAAESGLENAETLMRTSDTAAGRILGTPAYMSPEQAEGKPIDHRSDIFSLGIVLYEMATGKRPFAGDTPISTISAILKDQPKSVSDLKAANPRELSRIISHCLEKDPERRFQSAKDVRNQLDSVRKELDSGEIVPPIPARRITAARGRTRALRIAVPAALVVIAGAWFGLRHWGGSSAGSALPPSPPAAPDRQMAVVFPFQNLGPADDEYFAAGISEEITSRLASVSGLGVISRTSAENYDRSGKTMKQIAADLGVHYVLDGSVRWAKTAGGKGRVRITPQLVRVSDDTPIWTETYDREVSDIFDVQTDIATHVVEALGVTLHAGERKQLAEKPTSNMEAYQLYLRAKDLVCDDFSNCDRQIVSWLERAVELDPGFLAASAHLVRQHALMYHINADRTEARLGRARSALERMDAVDAGHPLTRLARGFYYYHGYRDYDRALTEFHAAAEARPNDAEAMYAIALIDRRKGDIAASVKGMERCIEVDPKNAQYLLEQGSSYDAMRMPARSLDCFERSYAINLDPATLTNIAFVEIRHNGDIRAAEKTLARAPDPGSLALLPARMFLGLYKRDYDGAIAAMRGSTVAMPSIQSNISGWLGIVESYRVGREQARPQLESAAREIEAVLHDAPGDYGTRGILALVYAFLNRPDDAIREARLATEVVSKDAYAAPTAMEQLASVYANSGHPDDALDLIERLLQMNYESPLTVPNLRMSPLWDPLRDHPKFKELMKRSA